MTEKVAWEEEGEEEGCERAEGERVQDCGVEGERVKGEGREGERVSEEAFEAEWRVAEQREGDRVEEEGEGLPRELWSLYGLHRTSNKQMPLRLFLTTRIERL